MSADTQVGGFSPGVAAFFTAGSLQSPSPGLPTLRAFQAAQAEVARAWLSERTGWR